MNKTQKFLEIKEEIDQFWSKLTWTRKKELVKELYKISSMSTSFYRTSLIVILPVFFGSFFGIYKHWSFFKTFIEGNRLFVIVSALLFVSFSVFILVSYLRDKKFNKNHGDEFKALELKLLQSIKNTENDFFEKVSNIVPVSREKLKELDLPADMIYIFIKDIEKHVNKFDFNCVDDDINLKNDESNSATRYALLEQK